MAKKRRRSKRRPARPPTPVAQAPSVPKPTKSVPRPVHQTVPERHVDLSEQYAYVRKDLQRIAALAGFFFAVLIALSFVLR